MTIELSGSVEEQLRGLAAMQHREILEVVEEAIRQYLEAAAITDLDALEVAETQAAIAGEISDISEWKIGRG